MRILKFAGANSKSALLESSLLSWIALISGVITTGAVVLGVLVVRTGTGTPEDELYFRQLMSFLLGMPVLGATLVIASLAIGALVSHRRHGLALRLPVITLGLCALSIALAQLLGP